MSTQAKHYVGCIIGLGSLVCAGTLAHWKSADLQRFIIYLLLALLAGALKVRLPGMTGTYSLTFLFVLIGVAELTPAETVTIACVSMIVQCIWRPAQRPMFVQVIFNVAAVAISVSISFFLARSLPELSFGADLPLPAQLALAAGLYFVTNTLLVSGVLALVEDKPFKDVWAQWFRWSFVYYSVGVAVATVAVFSNRYFSWTYSLLLLPVMYFEYVCYRVNVLSASNQSLKARNC